MFDNGSIPWRKMLLYFPFIFLYKSIFYSVYPIHKLQINRRGDLNVFCGINDPGTKVLSNIAYFKVSKISSEKNLSGNSLKIISIQNNMKFTHCYQARSFGRVYLLCRTPFLSSSSWWRTPKWFPSCETTECPSTGGTTPKCYGCPCTSSLCSLYVQVRVR